MKQKKKEKKIDEYDKQTVLSSFNWKKSEELTLKKTNLMKKKYSK